MKDDTKFYTVTVLIFFILILVASYWIWSKFGDWVKLPVTTQPAERLIEETVEDTSYPVPKYTDEFCELNPIECKG